MSECVGCVSPSASQRHAKGGVEKVIHSRGSQLGGFGCREFMDNHKLYHSTTVQFCTASVTQYSAPPQVDGSHSLLGKPLVPVIQHAHNR